MADFNWKRVTLWMGIVILLSIIGATWGNLHSRPFPSSQMDTSETAKEIPEELEKCVCGRCDVDIFNCDCPTAKEQREELRR